MQGRSDICGTGNAHSRIVGPFPVATCRIVCRVIVRGDLRGCGILPPAAKRLGRLTKAQEGNLKAAIRSCGALQH